MSAIDAIAGGGGFVTDDVIARTVTWSSVDPKTGERKEARITAHYADLPAGIVRSIFRSDADGRDERFLESILRNPDGSPGITAEQASKLRAEALAALVGAGLDVIGMSDTARAVEKKT